MESGSFEDDFPIEMLRFHCYVSLLLGTSNLFPLTQITLKNQGNLWVLWSDVVWTPRALMQRWARASVQRESFLRWSMYIHIFSWWFQIFFMFTPIWGNDPIWLTFFRWVETTNYSLYIPTGCMGLVYLPTNLPLKKSIHGSVNIPFVPWILWDI